MGSSDFPQLTTVKSVISKAVGAVMDALEELASTHSLDKCLPPHGSHPGLLTAPISRLWARNSDCNQSHRS